MLLLPLSFLASVAPLALDCPYDDHLELSGNDSCLSATELPYASGSHGRLSVTDSSDDYYRLEMLPGSSLTASIDFRHLDADLDLHLRGSSNGFCTSVLDTSYSVGNHETVQWTNTSSTSVEVILRVDWYSSAAGNSCANYDLDWAILSGPCGSDIDEPNDSWTQPSAGTPLVAVQRTIMDGNEDWYYMPRHYPNDDIYARIDFTHAEGDIDIQLWHVSGLDGGRAQQPIATSYSVDDFEEIRASGPDDFGYYLRVYRYGGPGSCNEYTLTLTPNTRTSIGATVCDGRQLPSSPVAFLSATGSSAVADNDFKLSGPLFPAGSVGMIIGGYGAHSVFNMTGNGELCISNAKYFTAPGQIFATGPNAAVLSIDLDLNTFPANGTGQYYSVLPGDSWALQLWFQTPLDASPGYSDAVLVQFD